MALVDIEIYWINIDNSITIGVFVCLENTVN